MFLVLETDIFKDNDTLNKKMFIYILFFNLFIKVEMILKGSLDSISSSSPSVKIQIMGGKVWLRRRSKTLLGVVNKHLDTQSLLTMPSNVLPLPALDLNFH